MIRRQFLASIWAGAIAIAASAQAMGHRILPKRFLEAIRAKRYPGPMETLDENDVKKPAKWAG